MYWAEASPRRGTPSPQHCFVNSRADPLSSALAPRKGKNRIPPSSLPPGLAATPGSWALRDSPCWKRFAATAVARPCDRFLAASRTNWDFYNKSPTANLQNLEVFDRLPESGKIPKITDLGAVASLK